MKENFTEKAIGARIKKARVAAKLTQYQLYEKTGIATTQLSAYENGSKNVGIDNLYKIAKATKTTIDELYVGPTSKKPINISNNKGELIVNCVHALYKSGVVSRTLRMQTTNAFGEQSIDYEICFCEYSDLLEELIRKLDDLEKDKDIYKNPQDIENQYLEMTAKKINNRDKPINPKEIENI